ncbi:hypothetical protein HRI_002261000 [Hibiscus trionum]|uniref:Fucosyltransferase n=1 Tax=Hibiscus trionum TaxID=183268 RepID=A0A9W7HZM0_HIBTR|nr:hypothetical protein HRI_002261000 [Hibiscus trionum]
MGTVIDSHFLALTSIVTVGYQLFFFIITALLKFDKVADFAGSTNFVIIAVLTLVIKGSWHFRQELILEMYRHEFTDSRSGYKYVMTTSLSSDVPVGYFSWADCFHFQLCCRNFRIRTLVGLEKKNIKIDSYGKCHGNHDGKVNKVETLKRYKFSLAFENTNEEDYVTEKFFQSLVAGSVPVVVGAPNIEDFAPSGSYLHTKELEDIHSVAERMKYLVKRHDFI